MLTITFVVCEAIYTRTHKRKIEWITIVGAILGGCIEILAPGNFVRSASEDNAAFEALSFFQKIQKNFFPIVNINVGRVNLILITLISCTVYDRITSLETVQEKAAAGDRPDNKLWLFRTGSHQLCVWTLVQYFTLGDSCLGY